MTESWIEDPKLEAELRLRSGFPRWAMVVDADHAGFPMNDVGIVHWFPGNSGAFWSERYGKIAGCGKARFRQGRWIRNVWRNGAIGFVTQAMADNPRFCAECARGWRKAANGG